MSHETLATLITTLSNEQGWDLSEANILEYERFLALMLPSTLSGEEVNRRIMWYHEDHQLVICMMHSSQPGHPEAWEQWRQDARGVLRRALLDWSRDTAIEFEDLIQLAAEALAKSLPSFAFASSFRTWSYQVIINAVKRYLRDRNAKKRLVYSQSASLDNQTLPDHEQPYETFDGEVNARLLKDVVDDVLSLFPDQRSAEIFKCWLEHDLRLSDLGERFHLSQSRISILLDQVRDYLKNDPRIRDWKE